VVSLVGMRIPRCRPGFPFALLSIVALAVTVAACASTPEGSAEELSEPFGQARISLTDGEEEVVLDVYVADTWSLRRQGLMGWESLPPGTGMLFVFDRDTDNGFWMKDTLIPLTIAFADADGGVHTVLDMEPCEADPCPTYEPERPYRYALEVAQGAFDDLGLGSSPGWRLAVRDSSP
jgi:uncharacterized protein